MYVYTSYTKDFSSKGELYKIFIDVKSLVLKTKRSGL